MTDRHPAHDIPRARPRKPPGTSLRSRSPPSSRRPLSRPRSRPRPPRRPPTPSPRVGTDAGSRERAFAAASAEFGVPQPVLEAVSYAQTRWDFHPGHSTSGGYGPMHLVDADLGSRSELKGLGDAPEPTMTPAADTLTRRPSPTGRTRTSCEPTSSPTSAAAPPSSPPGRNASACRGSRDRPRLLVRRDRGLRRKPGGCRPRLRRRHLHGPRDRSPAAYGGRQGRSPCRRPPARREGARLGLAKKSEGPVDCPEGLDCEWIPALHEKRGPSAGDYGNHDLADRPNARRSRTSSSTTRRRATRRRSCSSPTRRTSRGSTRSARRTGTSPSTSSRRTSAGTRATGTSTATRSASSTRASRRRGRSGSASRCTARRRGSCVTSPRSTTSRSTCSIFGTTRSLG